MCSLVADDEAVGMGGTIAKFADQKYDIIKVVFSFGELSHPHMQEDVVIEKRLKETKEASEAIGIKDTIFLGLKDSKLMNEVRDKNTSESIRKIILKFKPEKIFTPTSVDNHPTKDHLAVNKTVLEAVDSLKKHYDVYGYEVWDLKTEKAPFWYVDITSYFNRKVNYFIKFKSQWPSIFSLIIPVYIRSIYYGRKNKCRFAERFYKLR